jgi:hypothetical protein
MLSSLVAARAARRVGAAPPNFQIVEVYFRFREQ